MIQILFFYWDIFIIMELSYRIAMNLFTLASKKGDILSQYYMGNIIFMGMELQ